MSELADTRRDAHAAPDLAESPADRVAARLRAEPVDAAAVARAEVRFVEAARMRDGRKAASRAWIGVGFAVACALVIAVVIGRSESVSDGGEGGRPVAQTLTPLRAGQVLDGREPVRGRLGHATLELSRGAHAEIVRDALHAALVRLDRGELFVDFQPLRRGKEHLAIETPSARVEVVGTAFVVRVAADGATRVEVTHGVVEVLARATGVRRRLTVGASIDVGAVVAAAPPAPVPQLATSDSPVRVRVTDGDSQQNAVAPQQQESASTYNGLATARDVRLSAGALPSLESALAALDAGDTAPSERLAQTGARAARLDALEALADHHERRGSASAAESAYAKILALDPHGARGATACFARASLRERVGAPGAADDFVRYLAEHPRGALAAQARVHLCSLAPARCPPP